MDQELDEIGLAKARALIEIDRPEKALQTLSELSAEGAMSTRAFELRAAAYGNLDRWRESAEAASHGLERSGPNAFLQLILGTALHHLGEFRGAEHALLEGLTLEPSDPDLLCRYARLCIDVGQIDKAAKLTALAAAEAPSSANVYATRILVAIARAEDREAQQISREFLAEYPDHPAALASHGAIAGLRGEPKAAYKSARQAVAAMPSEAAYAELALDARVAAHPMLAPLRPFARFGPIKVWLAAIVVLVGLRAVGLTRVAVVLTAVWVVFCVYSWIAPPLVRALVKRRVRLR